ncbi:MAG TPA: DegT/DnrJ/EryC1/StrS family aminotransferase, partial [Saprospiraceae bacterium]|nr:DegT/DnrJ/EryC1/StrS family aminotransferase [Saprospiraceae bacterium]
MEKYIPYENLKKVNKPYEIEIQAAISEVVASGWYILGQQVERFEQEFSEYLNVQYCIGVANG